MEEKNKFWGNVFGIATLPTIIVGGLAKGLYNVATGTGSFDKGAEEGMNIVEKHVVKPATEFGNKKSDDITAGLVVAGSIALAKGDFNKSKKA